MRLRVAHFRADLVVLNVAFFPQAVVCSTKKVVCSAVRPQPAQGRLAMLSSIKDQLKNDHYDPNDSERDLDACFNTADESSNKAERTKSDLLCALRLLSDPNCLAATH